MHKTCLLWPLVTLVSEGGKLVWPLKLPSYYYYKESRQNSTVEEDSEGDNDSEEFYYGGQVSTPAPPNSHSQR